MANSDIITGLHFCSRCGKKHEHFLTWKPFPVGSSRYVCQLCWTEKMDKIFELDSKFNLENEKLLYEEDKE